MTLDEFETYVLAQKPVPASAYDAEYFVDDWRNDPAAYTLKNRRRIEGRNPQLIKDVFQPNRVLDMGCGPGNLMYLLYELGLDVSGIDASEHSKRLAPSPINQRITVGSVVATPFEDDSFDLVICREVLEHLTVLELARTVTEMCRVSARYVYVTTRYHPNPASLLDVTTQFDVDPTHITLMNKDFVRILFTLAGMRRRPNLEAAMDWMGKDRVLVYEKVA